MVEVGGYVVIRSSVESGLGDQSGCIIEISIASPTVAFLGLNTYGKTSTKLAVADVFSFDIQNLTRFSSFPVPQNSF